MKRVFLALLVGFILGILFIFYGGADYIRDMAGGAARRIERYEKKMAGMKERAERVRRRAEEAGKKIEKYIP